MITVHLPTIHAPTAPVAAQADWAAEFVQLWLGASWQVRRNAQADPRLTAAARRKAGYLATHFSHIDPEGRWPHQLVREFGYRLPVDWPDDANYIESLVVDWEGPRKWLQRLYESPGHHDHVCGIGFFANQTRFGVGVSGDYMALITCPVEVR